MGAERGQEEDINCCSMPSTMRQVHGANAGEKIERRLSMNLGNIQPAFAWLRRGRQPTFNAQHRMNVPNGSRWMLVVGRWMFDVFHLFPICAFNEPQGKERGGFRFEFAPTSPHPDPLPWGEGTRLRPATARQAARGRFVSIEYLEECGRFMVAMQAKKREEILHEPTFGARVCDPRQLCREKMFRTTCDALKNSDVAAAHRAALRYSRNAPNSFRNRALLHGQSFGSRTSFALVGLFSM